VFVPREVLLDEQLPANAKLLFAIIQSLDHERGCFASNEYLGGMLGLSESAVRQSLSALEQGKYITRTIDSAGNRSIKTCVSSSFSAQPRQISGTTPAEICQPPQQKSGTYSNRKKRIVDIRELTLPPLPHGQDFAKAWEEWMGYRKELKKPLTATSIREQLNFLTQQTEHDAVTSIQQSIRSGWVGLFPANRSKQQTQRKLLTDADHESF
jgi:hypothetical protein